MSYVANEKIDGRSPPPSVYLISLVSSSVLQSTTNAVTTGGFDLYTSLEDLGAETIDLSWCELELSDS